MLSEVEDAISALLTGALEYEIRGRRVKRADLDSLRRWRADLKQEIQYESDGGGMSSVARYIRP